jgi:DNA-directed RNA polymerase
MLKYLLDNKDVLEEFGLLMPSWLANVEPHIIFRILREDLLETNNKQFKFSTLVKILDKRIQQARYEQLIIRIATAYEGLSFYLPAFLDFRGRISRTGILNFHERSLIRSLILFDDDPKYEAILSEQKDEDLSRMRMYYYCSAASHYKSFYSIKESMEWFSNILEKYKNNNKVKEFIQFSSFGKNPFQFISMFQHYSFNAEESIFANIPISMDASSSAYQIMSYLLFNKDLAKRTNLITGSSIQDLYSSLLEDISNELKSSLDKDLADIVCKNLTRGLVKSIYMPLVYGKTQFSAT